ncbi:Nif11-like leader peptide family natural product precursor [Nostoc sp. UHCC 0870]|uniref:Nif11-like leader peptide family natural product precursor n=1 Tax=Nostoc sp. UHCC 0870 TaxID=2914041 RepID=UPI001EDD6A37|nr:Nif11-like leader peptide family natural product precursor [Nostoc sp. UHCC 0870]UKO96710.1 Nif11-like leader peptide family natural product precursor [Nostoc sp. UHCC 0870]
MSKENLEKFYQEVLQDSAMQDKFRAVNDANSLAQLAVELGKEKGYDFNIEEVKIYSNNLDDLESEELSDELLQGIAGGGNGICWKSR